MRSLANIAALHGAYWSFDRWYRIAWYVWPASLALLICGWIVVEKPAAGTASAPGGWAKPVPTATPLPVRRSPVLANWPKELHDDVTTCFSNGADLNPLVEACTRLIESGKVASPQLAAAYNQRGFIQRLKQPDRALQDFDAALKIQPNYAFALVNRAFIYMMRSRFDSAIEDLNRAIDLLAPGLAARAHYLRGFSYARLKNYDKAIADLDEAQRVEPNNPDPYLARADVEQLQQHYDAALRDFDEFSKHAPRDPRGLIGRAAILEATGRPQEALAALDSAVSLDPANTRALAARDRLRAQQSAPERPQ
ncbi:tetratricopeptide repeat protein [Bradyrhizobium sp. ARR65]|uniref:tetratricopeptide repeat protein n=1 Tax=Bradyrhizobium sp. ARR65 TaxID=1040989 RepID=UPI0004632EC9|nr:tetratricopeptide repeat protein [Bradyrhizobium sp. ARR65]